MRFSPDFSFGPIRKICLLGTAPNPVDCQRSWQAARRFPALKRFRKIKKTDRGTALLFAFSPVLISVTVTIPSVPASLLLFRF